jgi:hypothetical protein
MERPREVPRLPSVLMVGTGEYTTGITHAGAQSKSDKRLVRSMCNMSWATPWLSGGGAGGSALSSCSL